MGEQHDAARTLPSLDRIEAAIDRMKPFPDPAKARQWREAVAAYRRSEADFDAILSVRGAAEGEYFRLRGTMANADERLGMVALETAVTARQSEADAAIAAVVATPAPTAAALAEKLQLISDQGLVLGGDVLAAVIADAQALEPEGWRDLPTAV